MLEEDELETRGRDLEAFQLATEQQHIDNTHVLEGYPTLLQDYQRLRKDYVEVKECRDKHRKLKRDQRRNPFVLVLIDGDGYLFHDALTKAREDGGVEAAQRLHDGIDALLTRENHALQHCRIKVRVYANLTGLSKVLANNDILGSEDRSLSSFSAGFTRGQYLFDFVDAGDKKEGADAKIRDVLRVEMFRLFIDNPQCRHIFFAGCHDAGYVSLLTPYRNRPDRLTLVKGASFHSDYLSLGLEVITVPSVFRTVKLQNKITSHGSSCKYSHINAAPSGTTPPAEHGKLAGAPSSDAAQLQRNTPKTLERAYIRERLPQRSEQNKGLIPINKDGYRLDTLVPIPTDEQLVYYAKWVQSRHDSWLFAGFNDRPPCNRLNFLGECERKGCKLSHVHQESNLKVALAWILKTRLCTQKGGCRNPDCFAGHVCQQNGCYGKNCKFTKKMHDVDITVAAWLNKAGNTVHVRGPEPILDLAPASSNVSMDYGRRNDITEGNQVEAASDCDVEDDEIQAAEEEESDAEGSAEEEAREQVDDEEAEGEELDDEDDENDEEEDGDDNTSDVNVQFKGDEGECDEDSDDETAVGSDDEVPAYDEGKNAHYNNEHAAKRIRLESDCAMKR